MTLIVEDGSIVAGAESYISVADAETFLNNRGLTLTGAESDKEAALRKATDYMVQVYRMRWQGWKVDQTQALDWPRNSVYVDQSINYDNTIVAHLVPNNIVPLDSLAFVKYCLQWHHRCCQWHFCTGYSQHDKDY